MRRRCAVVVGSGIGGLLAAAALCRRGWRVTVLERLPRAGGRFAGRRREGFQLPTGAFHTLPYGSRGFLARALRAAGLRVRLAEQPAGFVARVGSRRFRPLPLPIWPLSRLPLWSRSPAEYWRSRRVAAALLCEGSPIPDLPLADLLSRWNAGPDLKRLAARIVAFAQGIPLERASAVEFFGSARLALRWRSGVIRGGCQAVVEGLTSRLREGGAALLLCSPVEEFVVEGGRVRGVVCRGKFHPADLVVSNAGPSETVRLLGEAAPRWLRERAGAVEPACVAAYGVSSARPLVPHAAVELRLDSERIAGYIQVTNAAPELAPAGRHLLMALSLLPRRGDVRALVAADRDEIRRLFPGADSVEVFHTAIYRRRPAAETPAAAGSVGSQRYPLRVRGVEGLLMLGHDSVGIGYAGEIIGYAALRFGRLVEREGREWYRG